MDKVCRIAQRCIVKLTKLSVDLDTFELELDLPRQLPDRVGVAIPSGRVVWVLSIHVGSALTTTRDKLWHVAQRTKVSLSLRGCYSARTPGPSSA